MYLPNQPVRIEIKVLQRTLVWVRARRSCGHLRWCHRRLSRSNPSVGHSPPEGSLHRSPDTTATVPHYHTQARKGDATTQANETSLRRKQSNQLHSKERTLKVYCQRVKIVYRPCVMKTSLADLDNKHEILDDQTDLAVKVVEISKIVF